MELSEEAKTLLKGCRQHFANACTRIRRLTAVIPEDGRKEFKKLCKQLQACTDNEEFQKIARRIVHKWPRTSTWIAWWTRPSHAPMIFKSQVVMDADIWDSIPDDTNAEESMHWRLYCGASRDHDLISGLYALHGMAQYFERLFTHVEGM
jgi:hypothetical protein